MSDIHTMATPTFKNSNLTVVDEDFPDYLFQQLYKRLLVMAGEAHGDNDNTEEKKSELGNLITLLYNSQNKGAGALPTPALKTLSLDITILKQSFPHIIGEYQHNKESHPSQPIIVFGEYVAFRRAWLQLIEIVDYLQRGGSKPQQFPSTSSLEKINWHLGNGATVSDEQKRAAISIATLPFCIITGGAGTGKTTTLAKGLELILLDAPSTEIILAAPTGKAAHRLNESLAAQMGSVHNSIAPILQKLKATTIHRLLGMSEQTGKPFHHKKNPLRCDVIAVDEASMIGGDIFTLLQHAVLPHTRIIMLGDANQLPAINSTAFFNDISRLRQGYDTNFCNQLNSHIETPITPNDSPLPNAICQLSVSRRFAEKSQIEKISHAILNKKPDEVLNNLGNDCLSLSTLGSQFVESLISDYADDTDLLLHELSQRIILCANRQGAFGSEIINRYFDNQFRKRLSNNHDGSLWYHGRRIMIEQNDYQLGVNNGDIGFCKLKNGNWIIVFDDDREILVSDLLDEKYSLAFAISIHKSQGSEYPHVDIVLDNYNREKPNRLVTQALIYTAVTRAKKTLRLYSDQELIHHALLTDEQVQSPLQALLQKSN
ncbi:MAG: exodeoxyribonuclease V subunit alpha [Gammaproteobacteria bacterium]|nr:exodeoxyribonuclease V subunit alpha [Gammaproteobacteria bacterium]